LAATTHARAATARNTRNAARNDKLLAFLAINTAAQLARQNYKMETGFDSYWPDVA
jgi:hypothetical protein